MDTCTSVFFLALIFHLCVQGPTHPNQSQSGHLSNVSYSKVFNCIITFNHALNFLQLPRYHELVTRMEQKKVEK